MTTADALNAALRSEHAALSVYGVLIARTSRSEHPDLSDRLTSAYADHRRNRDRLTARVVALHGEPAAAAAAYEIPETGTPRAVRIAALGIEKRSTQTYGTLVAKTTGDDRARAIRSLDESAARQLRFRGSPEIFPGIRMSDP